MSALEHCPSCGRPWPLSSDPPAELVAAETRSTEALLPETVAIESSRPPGVAVATADDPIEPPEAEIVEPIGASESNDTFATVSPDPYLDAILGPAPTSEAQVAVAVAGADCELDAPAIADRPTPSIEARGSSGDGPTPMADDRASAWPSALLVSYASAMTIACLWLGWQLREARRSPTVEPPAATADAGESAGGIREAGGAAVEPAAPIEPSMRVRLGEPLRVGSLGITPTAIRTGPILLEHANVDGSRDERPGGDDALILDLRLQNLADDAIFAPLDEAFVRDRERALPDSFLELADGSRVYGYALPVRSEWSLVGQAFADLRPGEVLETGLFSEPGARQRLPEGRSTWRVKVRVAPDRVETIGVEFDAGSVR